jgi:hypothetical protein
LEKNRTQRKLPGGEPPVVTYSRRREEDLPDVYDDGRAEPRFEDELVAEWDAVEIPPEPPLHARRRARPLVEPVRTPVDEADFEDRAVKPARAKRSTSMRLVAVAAVAAVLIGVAILVFAFGNSTTVTVSAPALNEEGAEPGTVPADDVANANSGVREIPLTGDGGATDAGGTAAPAPVSTVPAEPPAPRARPEPPAAAATAVAPDFDQAAPMPPAEAALTPKAATAPVDPGADDDFIARIERTLAETDGSSAPALSPASEQPIQLTPQAAEPSGPIPPEDIPMVDGQGQPLTLPNDFLLLDTE